MERAHGNTWENNPDNRAKIPETGKGESEMAEIEIEMVIDKELARGSRPGYPDKSVTKATVDSWIDYVKSLGIPSIICLLAEDQLSYYGDPPSGLISYYKENGLNVEHIPAEDYQQPPLSPEQLDNVWKAYRTLPKPVLVHCSAGIDRTGEAIKHIKKQLKVIS